MAEVLRKKWRWSTTGPADRVAFHPIPRGEQLNSDDYAAGYIGYRVGVRGPAAVVKPGATVTVSDGRDRKWKVPVGQIIESYLLKSAGDPTLKVVMNVAAIRSTRILAQLKKEGV